MENQVHHGVYKTVSGHTALIHRVRVEGKEWKAVGAIQTCSFGRDGVEGGEVWFITKWTLTGKSLFSKSFDLVFDDQEIFK